MTSADVKYIKKFNEFIIIERRKRIKYIALKRIAIIFKEMYNVREGKV